MWSTAASKGSSMPSRIMRLVAWTESGALAAISSANSSVRVHQLVVGDDLVNQTDIERFLGVEHAAAEGDFGGASPSRAGGGESRCRRTRATRRGLAKTAPILARSEAIRMSASRAMSMP